MSDLILLTVEDVAAQTGLQPRTIRKQIATGKVDAVKVGTQWLFTEQQAAQVKRRRKRGQKK